MASIQILVVEDNDMQSKLVGFLLEEKPATQSKWPRARRRRWNYCNRSSRISS